MQDPATLGDEKPNATKQRLWLLVRVSVSLALLFALLYRFSPAVLFAQLSWDSLPALFGGLMLVFLAITLNALRWTLIIKGMGATITTLRCMAITLVGHFFSQLLPTSVGGDVVRIWSVRQQGLTTRDAISSVLIDRLSGVAMQGGMLLAGLPFIARELDSRLSVAAALCAATAIPVGVIALLNLHRMPERWHRFLGIRQLIELSSIFAVLLRRPILVAAILALSLAVQMASLLLTISLARVFGAHLSFLDALTIVPAVILISNLPISIGGWGVREAGLAAGFSLLGLPTGAAISSSIVVGILNLIAGLPGGLIFASRWGLQGIRSRFASTS